MHQIWHRDEKVLSVIDSDVIVHLPEKLPFDLRPYKPVTYKEYLSWINRRLNTLQRSYMNKLYMQRRIGRSHADIINDSAAISITDQFWVTRDDLNHTWESLQVLRDDNLAVVDVCLDGRVNLKEMYAIKRDHTSVFSIKGAFEKAPYKGYLIKKGNNAEYEISAYRLGKYLGISVAEAEAWSDGKVACRIFTDDNTQ